MFVHIRIPRDLNYILLYLKSRTFIRNENERNGRRRRKRRQVVQINVQMNDGISTCALCWSSEKIRGSYRGYMDRGFSGWRGTFYLGALRMLENFSSQTKMSPKQSRFQKRFEDCTWHTDSGFIPRLCGNSLATRKWINNTKLREYISSCTFVSTFSIALDTDWYVHICNGCRSVCTLWSIWLNG